jgi:hypothetical protein
MLGTLIPEDSSTVERHAVVYPVYEMHKNTSRSKL